MGLKKEYATTEEEIKQQKKLRKQLKVNQIIREKKMDNLLADNQQEQSASVVDIQQRLVFINEKLIKVSNENQKAREVIAS